MELIRFVNRQDKTDDFYAAVCQRAKHFFDDTGKTRYGDWRIALKALFFAGLTVGSYTLMLLNVLPFWGMVILATLSGLGLLGFLLNVAHDAAHGSLTPYPWLNRVLYFTTFNLIGINGYLWHKRHLNSHHIFPNINGCDTDIDNNPILRFSPNAPYKPWFRFQHWYALFAYLIVQVHAVYFKDFLHIRKKHLANMHNITHPWPEYLFFGLGKLVHIGVFLVLPALIIPGPFWHVLVAYLVMSAVNSVLFVMCFAGTHFADVCIFPIRPKTGQLDLTYAEHAMLASLDWNVNDPWSHFMVGGINAHAAHHLFPHVCHIHYPELTQIIQEEAKAHGIRYNETTLWGMVQSHFRLLKKLSVEHPEPGILPDWQPVYGL